MATLNYTTTISVDRTVAEVTKMLARRGVASVQTRFDEEGIPNGLGFSLRTPHGERPFVIRVRAEGVLRLILAAPKGKTRPPQRTLEHAAAVAWRVVRAWVEAQLALVDAELASIDEVMLPYAIARPDGATLYEVYREREMDALEPGGHR